MAKIIPFQGFRFNLKKTSLSRALCPPYDVIDESLAKNLRALPFNAIHLELPAGTGLSRYQRAARLWHEWREQEIVLQDAEPSLYVVEENFKFEGKKFRRLGFLAALSLDAQSMSWVLPHEKTLSAPKADRLKILKTVNVNFSPIFAIYPDKSGVLRKNLSALLRQKVSSRGVLPALSRTDCRLWRVKDAKAIAVIGKALKSSPLLIADGHHRLGAARDYFKKNSQPGCAKILAYFCAEDDPGLLVLPTHRISPKKILTRAEKLCRLKSQPNLSALLKALAGEPNPYAFGIFEEGIYFLAVPRETRDFRSRLSVEWLKERLFFGISPRRLRYSHDAKEAAALAASLKTSAVFVKPFSVSSIRKAAQAIGLLPPKSTYFYPKVPTGLAFNSLK